MPDHDRDALSWEGDDADDSLVRGDAADAPATTITAAPALAASPSDAAGTRVVGGAFLVLAIASAIGWVVVMLENPVGAQTLLGMAFYQLGELLAVLAPVLWWLAAQRLATQPVPWWIAGAVVTAPWPILAGVLG